MLELKKIKKSYTTGEFKQVALKEVSLKFRKSEFVSILGASGSGKTTLLNIIGGLDRYDSGDLIINQKSTKKFKEVDWDAYRNNCVGFIFQSYNLIGHISILDNIEMSLTLSGVGAKEKRERAMKVLEEVGLKDHAHKKPNQLSGGQMQRVAIARALVNDPDIILADEPTGALDSNTSVQIMNLIQKIAKDKLVIMVTHNPELASKYATRIVTMQDGKLLEDSNPVTKKEEKEEKFTIQKTAMNFFSALKLSFNNIKTKKGRTALTAFAASIGIIGIALILSLSNGFHIQIDKFEQETLSQMPIMITEQAMKMDEETLMKYQESHNDKLKKYSDKKEIVPLEDMQDELMHKNKLTKEYVDYIEKLDKKYVGGLSYTKTTGMNIVTEKQDGSYSLVDTGSSILTSWQVFPTNMENKAASIVTNNYDVLAGEIKANEPGLILLVDSKNRLSKTQLEALGFDTNANIKFEDLLQKEFKVIVNNDFYQKYGNYFQMRQDYQQMYQSSNSIPLKIQAILRGKEGKELITSGTGIVYTPSLVDRIIEKNQNSEIVQFQKNVEYNVLSGQPFDNKENSTNTKEMMLGYLGADTVATMISIYPKDFESKDNITAYLDDYNKDKNEEETILYNDMASMISSLSGNIMDAITIVLIAFSAISLVVSSIMIGIITYISVLERTKEIGILRALGARKKDIKRVFNAETCIIGFCSGLLGILIARLLIIPANIIIENLTELPNVAKLNPIHALLLIAISIVLTIISGSIPARVASKKDPVEALRTE